MKNLKYILKKEAKAFDNIVGARLKKGFIPDIRISKNYNFFFNNPWRNRYSRKISIDNKINFVLKELKKKDEVLEVGCGLGTLCYEICRKSINITGIDISKKSIDYCNFHKKKYLKSNDKINFYNISLSNFIKNLNKKTFDKIVFFKTLHHIPNLNKTIKSLKKIMKKKSKIIIVEPVRKNFEIENAVVAFLIRIMSDTWISKNKKLKKVDYKSIDKQIQNIYQEYQYIIRDKKQQSPLDNVTDDFEKILKNLKLNFTIEKLLFDDAFKDKIVGGIRGKNLKKTIELINNLDKYLINHKILKGSTVKIVAKIK